MMAELPNGKRLRLPDSLTDNEADSIVQAVMRASASGDKALEENEALRNKLDVLLKMPRDTGMKEVVDKLDALLAVERKEPKEDKSMVEVGKKLDTLILLLSRPEKEQKEEKGVVKAIGTMHDGLTALLHRMIAAQLADTVPEHNLAGDIVKTKKVVAK